MKWPLELNGVSASVLNLAAASGRRRWATSTAMCAALLAGAPGVAAAQGPADAAEVEEVVITAGSQVDLPNEYAGGQVARGGRVGLFGNLDVMDTPFATTNYTEELIRGQQARSVADILQNDPVVRVAKGFGNFQELYVIRGFPVYSDDMTYNGVYGVLPRQFVAAELLERVEVFHGPNTFLNGAAPGSSGVGGAFNLVPKRAPDEPLTRFTAGWEEGGQLYGAVDIANRFRDGDFGARLNLAKRNGETSVNNQERDLSVAALGVDYRGERLRFSADAGFQDQRIKAPRPSVTPFGEVPEPPSAESNYAQPWTYTNERQLFGVIRGEVDVTSAISAWAAVGARRGEEQNVLANPSSDAAGNTYAYRFDNAREDSVISADIGIRADIQTGPVGQRLVASASRVLLKSRNAYAFSNFFAGFTGNLYDPVDVAAPTADFFTGGDLDDPLMTERTENSSFAIADMLSLMDGKILATIGARYQQIQTETFDYNTGALGSSYSESAITPALGLVFKPSEKLSIYGNYSEALVPGQIAPATSGGLPVTNAGEVLDPFRAAQFEVGAKYDGGRIGGTISVFSITLPSAFVENQVFGENGEQRNRGIEVSVYGEPIEGLRLLAGGTILDAEQTSTVDPALEGKAAIGVPELQASFNAEWDVPMVQNLTLEGRVVHTGPQHANAANTVELESWTRIDVGARYGFSIGEADLSLRARLENLTNEDYWASVGGYPGSNYLVLGTPRTLVVSLSLEF